MDEWWAQVYEVKIGGEKYFICLTLLALGLLTMYNSSSEAERDISKLKQVYAGDKKSNISQTTLQAKMRVQAAVSEEGKSCERCLENDQERDRRMKEGERVGRRQVNHCHCSFLDPDPEVMAELRADVPGHIYNQKKDESKSNLDSNENKIESEARKKADEKAAKDDLMKEVRKLKRKTQEEAVKAAQEKAAAKEKDKSKNNNKAGAKGKTKTGSKRKGKVLKADVVAKRRRLGFLEGLV